MDLPFLGVGLVYCAGLDGLIRDCGDLVDVVEVEPQTLWYQRGNSYQLDESALARVATLPQPTVLHGIGFPVGGSRPPDPAQLPLWWRMIDELGPPWVSEHFSFNRAAGDDGEFRLLARSCGFDRREASRVSCAHLSSCVRPGWPCRS